MSKISKALTDYVIRKGMVDRADRNIYEYGFTIIFEMGIFIIFCLIVSIFSHMVLEGILFFVIFSPLRSYAGGLHMRKFCSCFILSCLTFSAVLLAVKYVQVPIAISFILLLLFETAVYFLYPVENANRTVDEEENKYFKIKLMKFLGLDAVLGFLCLIAKKDRYLQEIIFTFLIVVITMLIAKYNNSKKNACYRE